MKSTLKLLSFAISGLVISACSTQHYIAEPAPKFSHSDPIRKVERNIAKISNAIKPTIVYFDNDSHQLTHMAHNKLNSFMDQFNNTSYKPLLLEGHTDSNHSDQYNIKLSKKRTRNVKKALNNLGYPQYKIHEHAKGEYAPTATNKTDKGRQLNRRVVVYPYDFEL